MARIRKYKDKKTGQIIQARFCYVTNTYTILETKQKLSTPKFAAKYKVAFVK
jgi:hypothetical protein